MLLKCLRVKEILNTHSQTPLEAGYLQEQVKLFSVQGCWKALRYFSLKCNLKAPFPRELKEKHVHFSATLIYYSEPPSILVWFIYICMYLSVYLKENDVKNLDVQQ